MEKKSKSGDIHKIVLNRDYTEYHKTLVKLFGNDNPFAKVRLGAGYYLWADTTCKWEPLTTADEFVENDVRNAVHQARKMVETKLSDKELVDKLFTVPDDSYIYFTEDGGKVKILLTGWGFKKPVDPRVKIDLENMKKDNPVDLSFSFDGVRLVDYEFLIKTPQRQRALKTDEAGVFHFDNLSVGKSFVVIDQPTGKQINVVVTEGQSHYDFDVTTYADLCVTAQKDGAPMQNETVEVQFHGKSYSMRTNAAGMAVFKLPRYEGETISATVSGETKTDALSADGNRMEFSFETPKEAVKTVVRVSVFKNGESFANEKVRVEYAGNAFEGITDASGSFEKEVEIVEGEVCKATVEGFATKEKQLEERPVNEFIFEKKDEPKPEPPGEPVKDISIQLLDKMKKPMAGKTIVFKNSGQNADGDVTFVLDDDGKAKFPENTFPKNKPLTVELMNSDSENVKIPLTIEDGEYEYVLQEKETTSSSGTNIFLQVLAVVAAMIVSLVGVIALEVLCPEVFNQIYS